MGDSPAERLGNVTWQEEIQVVLASVITVLDGIGMEIAPFTQSRQENQRRRNV